MKESTTDIILPVALSFFAFLIILITVILFIYYARKKMFAKEIEIVNLKLKTKKDQINSMIEVQEAERARISRDIHDAISSNLVAIHLNLQQLKRISSDETTIDICDTAIKACTSTTENARRIAHNLMPVELEHVGLLASLDQLCEKLNKEGRLKVVLLHELSIKQFKLIKPEYQIHIYRIIQELITNSIKHGKANRIDLKLVNIRPNIIEFFYADNGEGTDLNIEEIQEGHGIQNIISRASIFGGETRFYASPQGGFSFILVIPLNKI